MRAVGFCHNIVSQSFLSRECGNVKLLTCFMYLLSFIICSMTTSSRAPKHVWTKEEEDTLVKCLVEFTGGWKFENGTFRPCYLNQLECIMVEKLPCCRVRAITVIDYWRKTLKWTFQAIAKMRGPVCTGFNWNDDIKCIIAKNEVFDNWVMVRKII